MSEEDVTDIHDPDYHPDKNDKSDTEVTQNQRAKILRRHACVYYGSRWTKAIESSVVLETIEEKLGK